MKVNRYSLSCVHVVLLFLKDGGVAIDTDVVEQLIFTLLSFFWGSPELNHYGVGSFNVGHEFHFTVTRSLAR